MVFQLLISLISVYLLVFKNGGRDSSLCSPGWFWTNLWQSSCLSFLSTEIGVSHHPRLNFAPYCFFASIYLGFNLFSLPPGFLKESTSPELGLKLWTTHVWLLSFLLFSDSLLDQTGLKPMVRIEADLELSILLPHLPSSGFLHLVEAVSFLFLPCSELHANRWPLGLALGGAGILGAHHCICLWFSRWLMRLEVGFSCCLASVPSTFTTEPPHCPSIFLTQTFQVL